MIRRSRGRTVVYASAALALSCQAVIGIEDLSGAPRPDGAAGSGGQGDDPSGYAGSDSGGSGGSAAGSGGSGGDPGGAGSNNEGGSGGLALGGAAGSGVGEVDLPDVPPPDEPGEPDAGPVEPPPSIVVEGRVIDFFRRPVPLVPVSIGGQTATTDAQGAFRIEGVEPPYDASLMLNFTRDGVPSRYGYVYQGLTRDDPTLQVYSALIQRGATSLEYAINDFDFETADPAQSFIVAFGSPDGRFVEEGLSPPGGEFLGVPAWTGPATIEGTFHGLRVVRDGGFSGDPPVSYEAHDSSAFSATDGEVAGASFDASSDTIEVGTVNGTIQGGLLGELGDRVSLRFEDGTAMPLLDETSGEEFSALVPDLPDSSLVVSATDGTASLPPYAVAWRDELQPGDDVALELPLPVVLSSPQNDVLISSDATFSWTPLGGSTGPYLWHLEFLSAGGESFLSQGMLVVSASPELTIPTFPDGFTVPPGVVGLWSVETHGSAASMDALAGPDGFLDPFSIGETFPVGPGRGGGSYTESARQTFTMGSD
jgi:hypothetical protein